MAHNETIEQNRNSVLRIMEKCNQWLNLSDYIQKDIATLKIGKSDVPIQTSGFITDHNDLIKDIEDEVKLLKTVK